MVKAMNEFVIPSWYGWVVLVMVSPGLIILIGVAIAFLFHRAPRIANDGPRCFHVLGFDPKTNASRELTLMAEDPSAARGLAQMQGIIVTDVTPTVMKPELPKRGEDLGPKHLGPQDFGLQDIGPENAEPQDLGSQDFGTEHLEPQDDGNQDLGPEDLGEGKAI
jgi:hypothetical protein